ncbi:cytochrome P450 11B1, mitochondrial-like [Dromiciops gliroides]|uniref:cytochrome P450 11B1, mitochondrial-like n=1 Tax=Dromiciops gliroides TaxID=33562 RepID=UPI001CC6585C|nr:cytochrome P450 11B1, mitochondrial-like [Dromiciops gliroides]
MNVSSKRDSEEGSRGFVRPSERSRKPNLLQMPCARGSSESGNMELNQAQTRLRQWEMKLGSQLLQTLLWRLGGCRKLMTGTLQEPFRGSESPSGSVRPFQDIPLSQGNRWTKMLRIWKDSGYDNLHLEFQDNFQKLGPIYRDEVGTISTVNVMMPQDVEKILKAEGEFPQRNLVVPWLMHRQSRKLKCGVFLLNGKEWLNNRMKLNQDVLSLKSTGQFIPLLNSVCQDFVQYLNNKIRKNVRKSLTLNISPYVFRFSTEASTYVLYGERLGLLSNNPNPDGMRFIQAMNKVISSTSLLLYTPVTLSRLTNSNTWKQHLEAWDDIFQYADKCIQRIYQEMSLNNSSSQYSGIMAELLEKADLSLDSIKANIMELTAGSVETTTFPIVSTLFELSRNQDLQSALRAESKEAEARLKENTQLLVKELPLLRATIKETLRLYPVASVLYRYLAKDTVLQNYNVPAGTLVQVSLYTMGRSPEVFVRPERYDPSRWLTSTSDQAGNQIPNFRYLSFGFGIRQCIGRRIAETEMLLFLHHVLKNFQIETLCKDNLNQVFRFVLHPKSFPLFTFRILT